MKIGIVDWGVGGLGFYKLLRQHRPDLDVIYLGDQGSPSYGTLTRAQLGARIKQISEEMRDRGACQLVVACNAASTVLPYIKTAIPAYGVIQPTLDHLARTSERGEIGVIGGARTIRSGSYGKPLRAAGYEARPRVAQPLSSIIEAGKQSEAGPELEKILAPIRHVPRLVLACTHYIVLADQIRALMPQVEFIDPATITWQAVAAHLPPKSDRKGESQFFTTGQPLKMQSAALLAFGVQAEIKIW